MPQRQPTMTKPKQRAPASHQKAESRLLRALFSSAEASLGADAHSPKSERGLLAIAVQEASQRLKEGRLAGQIIEKHYAADDRYILPLLHAAADGDEERALAHLRSTLRGLPKLLAHPYVWQEFQHLYSVWHPFKPDLAKQAQKWLIELIQAWAEGMTIGYKVSITPRGRTRRGQSPDLFPHLHDRDGWLLTPEAFKELSDAEEFLRVYQDLMTRLNTCLNWKTIRRRFYRESTRAARMAGNIGPVFEVFKRHHGIASQPLPQDRLQSISLKALAERKRGNPRHRLACELLGTLTWFTPKGIAHKLSPSLVHSTVKTLRKHKVGTPGFLF